MEAETEIPASAPAPAQKKPRKPAKRRAAQKPAPPPESKSTDPNADLDGLTASDCPFDCRSDRCVITEAGICGHPNKGTLQFGQNSPDVMDRYQRARKMLKHLAVDKRD